MPAVCQVQRLIGRDQETSFLPPRSFICCEMEDSSGRGRTLDTSHSLRDAGDQPARPSISSQPPPHQREEAANKNLISSPPSCSAPAKRKPHCSRALVNPSPAHGCGKEGAWPRGSPRRRPRAGSGSGTDNLDSEVPSSQRRLGKVASGDGQGPGCLIESAWGPRTDK